ncbi:MAG: lysine 2,3-aminomutase [Melioribacteraceae bacterium]|nr:lysine 2,3-aminomutase [Melioribacteraceae bacterium]MCF8264167.1 lysine 2,3-aminomutase [Melioribacteraceae bacterium]MCF8413929.1 lysine 2,3-aminomutase [Melioribacteraceae bacterium]MCF8430519.1 lysine 2,3-aminomutase [Melioribacteraceae bacterium]
MILSKKMKFYGLRDLENIPQMNNLSEEARFATKVVSHVLPFRTNNYIIEELIDWDNVPNDPIFQLTFMQRDMLLPEQFNKMADAILRDENSEKLKAIANEIRYELNPHPAGQMTANVPIENDEVIPGVQHKYRETALVFPSAGQTCHAYCTFCFRWAQFVGINDLKFATDESNRFQSYLKNHKEITDVLFTGGDPMVMGIKKLEAYILPLLKPEFEHIKSIRIGTKSISYWPFKYVTDKDADAVLGLLDKIVAAGKHLAFMAHFNHHIESSTPIAHEAIRRIRETGAQIRTQSPIIKHINDDAAVWAKMWKDQVALGMIPYYMFIERQTGAQNYFEVPLSRTLEIYRDAIQEVSGLCRTVRGPSMSATPGKVSIEGISKVYGQKVFVLNFLQSRNPDWIKRPFFAKYDESAGWLTDLEPAFGEEKFFYQGELKQMLEKKRNRIEKIEEDKEDVLQSA